jgi:hypothetical protein
VRRDDGTGRFAVEPLPRLAQLAPLFGMAWSRAAPRWSPAENSYAPEPETGRLDGGTVLVLRDAAGTLTVVPPTEHGLALLGDHRRSWPTEPACSAARERAALARRSRTPAQRTRGVAPVRPAIRSASARACGRCWPTGVCVRAVRRWVVPQPFAAGVALRAGLPMAAVRLPDGSREDWPATKR